MPDGHAVCGPCKTRVVEVHVDGRLVVLEARDEAGTYALWQTVGGGFQARYVPVGERVDPPWFRWAVHECQAEAAA